MADCKENNEATKEPEPPVTMKFDSPEESSDNSVNEEADKSVVEKDSDNSSSSNSMPNSSSSPSDQKSNDSSPKFRGSVLAASKFGNCFGVNPSELSSSTSKRIANTKPSLLRPSALSAVTNSSSTTSTTKSVLQPSKFQNPFCKVNEGSEESEVSKAEDNKDKDTSNDNESKEEKKETENDSKEKKEEKEREMPKFIALSKTTKEGENSLSSSTSVAASVSAPSFVFGQNLKERVAVAHDADSSDSSEKEETKEEPTNENGSSELMFSNAAAVCNKSTTKPGVSLSQAAQEMEEANRASKRKYDEVTLLTGEEDETNVLQINCKLFAFDKVTSGWQERGRGSLRLNDKDEESRLIGRAAGTQRLVLNTKIYPGMTAERAGPKSLRLTAMDAQGDVRIFIVQAAQKEVEQLHNLLMQRLKRAQDRQPKKLATEH